MGQGFVGVIELFTKTVRSLGGNYPYTYCGAVILKPQNGHPLLLIYF